MATLTKKIKNDIPNESTWFDDLVATIRVDELELNTGIASDSKQDFYKKLQSGNTFEYAKISSDFLLKIIIPDLLIDFLHELFIERKSNPLKIAFDLTDSKILVWAELNDDDLETEKNIILSTAKINAKYQDLGFHVVSMTIEKSDKLDIPPHYRELKIPTKLD